MGRNIQGHAQSTTLKHPRGFTIVELLIVIIVIAILAAIIIVTYTGIQGKANDSSIQADLRNAAIAIENFNTQTGSYPTSWTDMSTIGPKISKGAYATNVNNFVVCSNSGEYAIAAVSSSGKIFYRSSNKGSGAYTWTWTQTVASTCPNMLVNASTLAGWGWTNNTWANWLQ